MEFKSLLLFSLYFPISRVITKEYSRFLTFYLFSVHGEDKRTSILDMYALTCLQNKPKNLHESRYHLYLWQNKHEQSIKNRHIEKIETIIAINQIFFGKNFYRKKAAV